MNWQGFFSMGGYALYVWGAYAVAVAAMSGEILLLRRRRKTFRGDGGNQ